MPTFSLPVRWLVGSLVVLQFLDFFLTWALLSGAWRGDVFEANPLARGILESAGWLGLALFKMGVTLIILTAVMGVAIRRPEIAGRVLMLMCVLMLGVNGYSGWLLASPPSAELGNLAAENAKSTSLDGAYVRIVRFDTTRAAICADWREGRITLPVALERLARLVDEHRPTQPDFLQVDYPDTDRPEQLAGYLFFHASHDRPDAQKHRERLTAELAELYTPTVAEQAEQFMRPRRG